MSQAPLATVVRSLRRTVSPPDVGRTDGQLLQEFAQRQDPAAFSLLVRRHGPLVLGACRRVLGNLHDADDAFQAVFLVLARKAASLGNVGALAGWLHGVSYRIAMRAKRDAARRRRHEANARPANPSAAIPDVEWREVQAVLDEELDRLTAVYRAAFVLCCLQGHTQAEAARQLGVKEGTVSSRLTAARNRLRAALARRGVSLSALLASLAVAGGATASVPARMAEATADSAVRFVGGMAHGLSPRICTLAEGALKAMTASRIKLVTALVLTLGLLASGLTALCQRNVTATEPAKDRPAPAAPAKEDRVTYSGRVVGEDGKPVKGAKVYYHFITREEEPIPARATTDAEGRFSFTIARKDVPLSADAIQSDPLKSGNVVARADGFTVAWSRVAEGSEDLSLRTTADDTPLEGRFLDLEGRPLVGLRVRVLTVAAPEKGNLDDFVKAIEGGEALREAWFKHLKHTLDNPIISRHVAALLPSATTGEDGRFRLSGCGKEQLVELRVEGEAIETQQLYVRMRAGGPVLRPPFLRDQEFARAEAEKVTLLPNGFTHPVAPGQVVAGLVRDTDTGKPIPGAVVESYMLAGTILAQNTIYQTTADEQGRYKLIGLPRGEGNRIRIRSPHDRPYLPVIKKVPATEPFRPSVLEVELKRGVWVEVKASDKGTGEPVAGLVSYFPKPETEEEKKLRFLPRGEGYNDQMPTRNDGTFRFVAPPKPATLAFRADWNRYPIAKEAATIRLQSSLSAVNFQAFVEIDPKPGKEVVKVTFTLDAGGVVRGKLVGPDGQPVIGALAAGLRHDWFWQSERPLKADEFTAMGLTPDRPRLLCFVHPEKKLAGSVVVRGDEKGPVVVKLSPSASVSGRLLDADGKPVKNATLWFTPVPVRKPGEPWPVDVGLHVTDVTVRSVGRPRAPGRREGTDEEGRFRYEGLIPGLKYNLAVVDASGATEREQVKWEGLILRDLMLESGEDRALGDVKMQPFPKK